MRVDSTSNLVNGVCELYLYCFCVILHSVSEFIARQHTIIDNLLQVLLSALPADFYHLDLDQKVVLMV